MGSDLTSSYIILHHLACISRLWAPKSREAEELLQCLVTMSFKNGLQKDHGCERHGNI